MTLPCLEATRVYGQEGRLKLEVFGENYSKNAESNENQPSMSQKCGSISVKECVLEVALRLVTRCIYKV